MTELYLKPEAWTMPMMVKTAVEHGSAVKKGDVLLQIDLDKIDLALRDARAERDLAELAIRLAQEELPIQEKTLPLDLAAAQRAHVQAQEDLKRFFEVDRPLMVEEAAMMLKRANYYLESAREELKQLQKMYRDKDLTEETEEFILKRQKMQVEIAEFFVKEAKISHEETLKVQLPRLDQSTRDGALKAALAWEKAKNDLPLALKQKQLTLVKLKFEQDKAMEKLRNLEKDREAFTVRAPVDGIVYHGKCSRGQWTTSTVTSKLQRGGIVTPEEVFMTVVTVQPVFVRATVEEKDLHLLKVDQKGKVVPTGYPDLKLPGRIASLLLIPAGSGNFDARVVLEGAGSPLLVPGMNCSVKCVPFQKTDALTVPAAAIFEDEDVPDGRYVYVQAAVRQAGNGPVKVGKTAGDKTEILEGLREGELILTSKPDHATPAGSSAKPSVPEKKP